MTERRFPSLPSQRVQTSTGFAYFYACAACGVLVPTDGQGLHIEFHDEIERDMSEFRQAVEALQARVGLLSAFIPDLPVG